MKKDFLHKFITYLTDGFKYVSIERLNKILLFVVKIMLKFKKYFIISIFFSAIMHYQLIFIKLFLQKFKANPND